MVGFIRWGVLPGGENLFWHGGTYAICAASLVVLFQGRTGNKRDRDIRLILGPHELGSSDPAMWTDETLVALRSSSEIFGVEDELEGARRALAEKKFARAMFGARLAVARGHARGEELTDDILHHPEVSAKLAQLRKKPRLHQKLFAGDKVPSYLVSAATNAPQPA